MLTLRSYLRACTVLWLLCQTLSLAALVPTDCCAAHQVASASASPDCHQAAAGSGQAPCPMHTTAAGECPMHTASTGVTPDSAERCAMRGLCNAPASALAMLIPVPGVLAVAPSVARFETSVPLVAIAPSMVQRALAHDIPPPRA
jgi:hypothetical protein